MRRPLVALFSLSFAAASLGCTDLRGVGTFDQDESAIVNGTGSEPSDDAVVVVSGTGTSCTGTLIAPDVVLTALHCVTNFDSSTNFVCRSDGTLTPGSTSGQLGPTVDPAAVAVRWGQVVGTSRVYAKEIFSTNSPEACRDDLAVLVLESAPPIGDVPLVTLRFDRETKRREVARAVGYGQTLGTHTVSGRQQRTGMTVTGVGAPNSASTGDFGVAPRTLNTGEGPCKGDSGGPLFSEETGAQIGVYSLLVATSCIGDDVKNVYTSVAPFEALIRKALTSAGREPLVEPPAPTGSGGDAGATGQAGETGTAGAAGETGEGGAPSGSGGTTGGSGARAGAGGSGAVGGTSDGSGGDAAAGAVPAAAGTGTQSLGSGSRRDGGCAVRAAGASRQARWSWLGLSLAALTFVRRRRAR